MTATVPLQEKNRYEEGKIGAPLVAGGQSSISTLGVTESAEDGKDTKGTEETEELGTTE